MSIYTVLDTDLCSYTVHYSILQIGWYSEDEGLHLSLNLVPTFSEDASEAQTNFENEIDNIAIEPVSSPLINNNDRSVHGRSFTEVEQDNIDLVTTIVSGTVQDFQGVSGNAGTNRNGQERNRNIPVFSYEEFISRTWTLVVLAVAIFGTCAALWMFIYVLIKMCDGTLTGNQTMGLILLMGVTGLFASVVPWLLPPNEVICAVRHFLHPLIMVLCFAILLVKAMQLRSLVSVGLGGSLPQFNQIVSLVFMVLVQVVIAGEWYATSQPLGIAINEGYPECNVSRKRFLLLHLYPATLLLLAFFYGMTVLKIKRNFNEGRWITCATLFMVPVFAAWSLVYYFAPVQFHDPSVAVSITAVAGILLAAIFVPKMHTIAHQSNMKLANLDLYRSHNSDSTVFTGFSADFLPPFPPSKKHQKYYPVYAVPGPYGPGPAMRPMPGMAPPPFMTNMGPPPGHPGAGAGRVDFNGLNYVSTHQRRGPRMTTYSEWTQSRGRRRHSSSPLREEAVPSVIKSAPRSKSSSKDSSHQATASSGSGLLQSRGRPRTKRNSNNATQQQQPQQRVHQHHSSSANTTGQLQPQPPDGATGLGSRLSHHHGGHHDHHEVNVFSQIQQQQRMEHSRSPSDGMILTASGLSGLLSNSAGVGGGHNHNRNTTILQQNAQNIGNNSENHNSNQVVIVGGLNNDEDVYLTTS